MTIDVVNLKTFKYRGSLNWWYIGRGFKNKNWDLVGSPLANPFKVNKDDSNREEAIALYKEWLWKEMKKGIRGGKSEAWEALKILKQEYKKAEENNEYFALACWCKPRACHGDIIKKAIEWMIEQGL